MASSSRKQGLVITAGSIDIYYIDLFDIIYIYIIPTCPKSKVVYVFSADGPRSFCSQSFLQRRKPS